MKRNPRWNRPELNPEAIRKRFDVPPCRGCRLIQFHADMLPAPLQSLADELKAKALSTLVAAYKIRALYPLVFYISMGEIHKSVMSSWLESVDPTPAEIDAIEQLRRRSAAEMPPPPPPPVY